MKPQKVWNAEGSDWQGRIIDVVHQEQGAIGLLVEIWGPKSFKRCVDVGNINFHAKNMSSAELQFNRQGLTKGDVDRVFTCVHSFLLRMAGTFTEVDDSKSTFRFMDHVKKVYVTQSRPDFSQN